MLNHSGSVPQVPTILKISFLILLFTIQVQADAPISYNKELASDVELRGTFFTDDNADGFYVSFNDGIIQIDSDNHYTDKVIKIKGTALTSRLKKYNGFNVGYTHIADNGTRTYEIKPLEIDLQGFAYLTTDFSTVIINGMTGTTITTLTGLSGNQNISVPDGSSYDFNITNNQPSVWASTDGKNYTNKSTITINGSMVTTETGMPLQLFTNLEGVNGTGDIGIAYTNLTAIPRDPEYVWDNGNVSLYLPFNTTSGVDSQFVVLWGSDNNTEPAADSAYGSEAVWDSNYVYVSHMADLTTSSIKDSTSNGRTSTKLSANNPIEYEAEYGKSQDFSSDYITIPDSIDFDFIDFTFESYHNKDTDVTGAVMSKFYDGSDRSWEFCDNAASDWMDCYVNADGTPHLRSAIDSVPIQNWYYTAVRHDDSSTSQWYVDGATNGSAVDIGAVNANAADIKIGDRSHATSRVYFDGKIAEVRLSNILRSTGYVSTTSVNIHNPTASGTEPFYKSIGSTQTASEIINITASITGDNNTQSYNTSQSREFTLTPTGETNNVLVNTTSTDYDVTVTTYWTENTTLQTETATAGYAKQYINYTPSFNVTSADLNTTFTFNFSAQDYIGTATSTLNDVSKTTTRDGQDVNASVGSLTESTPYWWNVTVPYNNIFTLSEQSDITAYLGISESFTDSTYNDPEGLSVDSRLWKFGDGDTSSSSNPTHTYTSLSEFNANYSVTETATVSPQTIVREFNVSVEMQPPQNVTTVSHQTNVSIDWDDYAYADKYSVYELEDGFPYVDTNPTVDGVKDTIYDCAHEFLIFSPNPVNPGDYETSYPIRTSLGAYFFHEAVDNDDKLGDDDLIYYFDLDNDGLTVDDPAWKITNNIVKKYLWNGGSWQVTGVSDAVGASIGGSTHYPKHELFIPIAELGANWTNGSTVKVLVKREDSSLNPDVITWYPFGNINDTDTALWQEMVLNDPNTYTWLANVTLSNYTALNLTPFTIYHGAVSAWNGTDESDYTLFDVITEDLPIYSASGYISDIGGNPIAGATVYSCNGFVHEITVTNVSGYWIGYKFREDNYTICANKAGYYGNSIDIFVGSNLTNQNITLTAEPVIVSKYHKIGEMLFAIPTILTLVFQKIADVIPIIVVLVFITLIINVIGVAIHAIRVWR